ncbi:hypothetical protein BG000_010426 [Podila horticola]|nr:hypothetical protein BG000_010426 [Podila horticola]
MLHWWTRQDLPYTDDNSIHAGILLVSMKSLESMVEVYQAQRRQGIRKHSGQHGQCTTNPGCDQLARLQVRSYQWPRGHQQQQQRSTEPLRQSRGTSPNGGPLLDHEAPAHSSTDSRDPGRPYRE